MSTDGDDLEPDAETQARVIEERIKNDPTVALQGDVTRDNLETAVDPDKPVPVNMNRILDAYGADE